MFSYPRVDLDQGRPRVPSFYALEIFRAAEGRLPGFDELARTRGRRSCRAARMAGAAASRRRYRRRRIRSRGARPADRCRSGNHDRRRALPARRQRSSRPRATRAGAAMAAAMDAQRRPGRSRARKRSAALARHRLDARSYSPTALQNFAACPYRFFLQAIHRLEPREEVEAIEVIDPLTRGALFHEVQFEVLTALRAAGLPAGHATATSRSAYGALETTLESGRRTCIMTNSRRRSSAYGSTASTRFARTCANGCGGRPKTPRIGGPSASSSPSG